MCTTTKYLFNCGHEATHRFRSDMCSQARSRHCHIRDTNKWLSFTCRKCSANRLGWWRKYCSGTQQNNETYDDAWCIPSRCFVDVGYSNLDPFGTETGSKPVSPMSAVPALTESPRKTQSAWASFPRDGRNRCGRLLERIRLKNSSPCCEDWSQKGAYQAVRLEGCSDRIEGRIVDNHCESLQ
jgi:hypothetical protein